MDKLLNKINMIGGFIITILTAVLGEYWFLFAGFLVLNLLDYVTGWIKARFYNKNESSVVGAKGILKKVWYWVVIGIAFYMSFSFVEIGKLLSIDISLNFIVLFGWFTLAAYCINEIRSVFENLIEMNVNIPKWIIKGLEIAENAVEKTANEQIKINDD